MRVPVWRPRGQLSTPPTWTPLRGQDQTLGEPMGSTWDTDGLQRLETGGRGEAPGRHTLTFYTVHSYTCCRLGQ